MRDSSNAFVKELFDQDVAERSGVPSSSGGDTPSGSKRSRKTKARKKKGGSEVPTIANKFKTQLSNLTTQLDMCVPHYVRCVKPNARKLKYNEGIGAFEAIKSMRQLKYAGVMETVKIRQAGYPFRDTFSQFWSRAVMSRWHKLVVDPRTGTFAFVCCLLLETYLLFFLSIVDRKTTHSTSTSLTQLNSTQPNSSLSSPLVPSHPSLFLSLSRSLSLCLSPQAQRSPRSPATATPRSAAACSFSAESLTRRLNRRITTPPLGHLPSNGWSETRKSLGRILLSVTFARGSRYVT